MPQPTPSPQPESSPRTKLPEYPDVKQRRYVWKPFIDRVNREYPVISRPRVVSVVISCDELYSENLFLFLHGILRAHRVSPKNPPREIIVIVNERGLQSARYLKENTAVFSLLSLIARARYLSPDQGTLQLKEKATTLLKEAGLEHHAPLIKDCIDTRLPLVPVDLFTQRARNLLYSQVKEVWGELTTTARQNLPNRGMARDLGCFLAVSRNPECIIDSLDMDVSIKPGHWYHLAKAFEDPQASIVIKRNAPYLRLSSVPQLPPSPDPSLALPIVSFLKELPLWGIDYSFHSLYQAWGPKISLRGSFYISSDVHYRWTHTGECNVISRESLSAKKRRGSRVVQIINMYGRDFSVTSHNIPPPLIPHPSLRSIKELIEHHKRADNTNKGYIVSVLQTIFNTELSPQEQEEILRLAFKYLHFVIKPIVVFLKHLLEELTLLQAIEDKSDEEGYISSQTLSQRLYAFIDSNSQLSLYTKATLRSLVPYLIVLVQIIKDLRTPQDPPLKTILTSLFPEIFKTAELLTLSFEEFKARLYSLFTMTENGKVPDSIIALWFLSPLAAESRNKTLLRSLPGVF